MEFMSIPEAGAMLGFGRTKSYAEASRFRETGGREGMPNVRFGGSYVVPVWALRKMIDDALAPKPVAPEVAPEPSVFDEKASDEQHITEPTPLAKPTRTRRHRQREDQAALFDLPPAS